MLNINVSTSESARKCIISMYYEQAILYYEKLLLMDCLKKSKLLVCHKNLRCWIHLDGVTLTSDKNKKLAERE